MKFDKIRQKHLEIMKEGNDNDKWVLDQMLFNKFLDKIKAKNKNLYKFLIRSGTKYQQSIFKYMQKLIELEEVPSSFKHSTLIQIWKGKGSSLDLNMMRFIHMRSWRPKLLEALVTENMKDDIVSATPNIQLGGMPGAMSVDHQGV